MPKGGGDEHECKFRKKNNAINGTIHGGISVRNHDGEGPVCRARAIGKANSGRFTKGLEKRSENSNGREVVTMVCMDYSAEDELMLNKSIVETFWQWKRLMECEEPCFIDMPSDEQLVGDFIRDIWRSMEQMQRKGALKEEYWKEID
jgi:hypothetical protein